MGLSVRVYQKIKKCNRNDATFFADVIDDAWAWKIKNLERGEWYHGECVDRGIDYPYGAHNRFRERLLIMMDRTEFLTTDGKIAWDILPNNIPFIDLINFADNEGCLDWEVSEKIYQDFDSHKELAKQKMSIMDYEIYLDWLNVFDKARKNGVVVFM